MVMNKSEERKDRYGLEKKKKLVTHLHYRQSKEN